MNYLYLAFVAAAFIGMECFAGGTRLIYSLPAYMVLGFASVLAVFSIRGNKLPAKPLCLISSAIFFGYILGRCRLSPVDYLSRQDFFMVLGALTIYLLTALHIVKPAQRMQLLAVLMAIALGQVAVGLVQFSKENDFMLFGYGRYPSGSRASGQYISPNHLAGYLEVIAIMATSQVFWSKWKPWAKILAAYVALASFAGVLITGSRGGYLSTAFSILVFCGLSVMVVKIAFPERFVRVTMIVAAFLLLLSAALPVVVTSRLVRNRASEIFTPNMRVQLWQAALSQTKLNPIFGTGSGSYLYYGRKFRNPEVQRDPVRVHNDYLDLLAEYGALGVAGFLFFFGSHLWSGFHSFRWLATKRLQYAVDWRSDSLALNIGCLCAVAAYMVHSVVDFNLHIPVNALLMAFVFGILANPGLETFHAGKTTLFTNHVFRWAFPLLGIALLVTGGPKLPGEYYAEKARVAIRDKKFGTAVQTAKAGIRHEQNNPDLFYYLGEARRSLGDAAPSPELKMIFYRLASDSFKQGLAVFPQDVRLLLIEGWTLDALGQEIEAGKYFIEAIKWDPNWKQVHKSYVAHLQYLRASGKILQLR